MYNFNKIEEWSEPRSIILSKLRNKGNDPYMTEFESAFLCGLIRKYKPRKVLEVGINGGGDYCYNDAGAFNAQN